MRCEMPTNEPFKRSKPSTHQPEVDAALRIAHALEYIADQIGQLNAKLDKLITRVDGGKF